MVYGVKRIYVKAVEKMWVFFFGAQYLETIHLKDKMDRLTIACNLR